MRVLLSGIFRTGHLATSYQRAFTALGHEVIAFDVEVHRADLNWSLRNRISHRLTIGSGWVRRAGSVRYNQALELSVAQKRPDLVLAFNGEFIMPETVRNIRRRGPRFVIFHADNPLPPNYNARPETLAAARECDAFLIWSRALVERLRSRGIPADFLAFGWDETLFPFQGFSVEQDCDVAFVGGWDPRREAFLDEIARHFELKIWGPAYWGQRSRRNGLARRCWQGGELQSEDAATVFARARVNLNILRDQHYVDNKADGVIMRTFEVPGSGGFLLATRSDGATDLFPEDQTVGYFDNVSECLQKIDWYLRNSAARQTALKQAHALVAAKHRYQDRVLDLLAFVR
jgi:spore maturation protein CgeB